MRTFDTYLGIEPFDVEIDECDELSDLAEQARTLRDLPFADKLAAVKRLAVGAMTNAYEQMVVWGEKAADLDGVIEIDSSGQISTEKRDHAAAEYKKFEDIVWNIHPLSYALQQGAGCCRYQGALFFALGFEADLGNRHFIQAAPVNPGINTVFNEVHGDGRKHIVSIFTESLEDRRHDYTVTNPDLYAQVHTEMPGRFMFSYHRTESGLVVAFQMRKHVMELD